MANYILEIEAKVKYLESQVDMYKSALHYLIGYASSDDQRINKLTAMLAKHYPDLNLQHENHVKTN